MIHNHEVYYPLYKDKEHPIILVTGGRGCERPEQEIMMADLTIKQIKDVRVGDKVMGDDGTPRNVLALCSGHSEMYHVKQTSAEDYYVNDAHILTIKKSGTSIDEGRYPDYDETCDMGVMEYLKKSARFKSQFRGFKSESIPHPEKDVLIPPYLLGLWLGDGTSANTQITTPDVEIMEYLCDYADENGMIVTDNGNKGAAHTFRLCKKEGLHNPLMILLRRYNLVQNKHIPQDYISNSENVRLELLAGLLDSDGYCAHNGYEITQKREHLARQIKFIADTLGFRTSIAEKDATCNGKYCGKVYRVFINGDVWRIPCKVERKRVHKSDVHKNKDWHLSQLSVEPCGVGDWCGIVLDGNHRYLHADGTVTHNSGKSYGIATFAERLTFELKRRGLSKRVSDAIVHRILYTRYTMTSANISIIPEFAEKIETDGTRRFFRSTKTDIVNVTTGSRIMFRGIKTSSGNQTAKLKSIHGITTFICDEAEEWTSDREFETIALSIRQPGIQNRIIIIMNPTDSNHFIYQKYIKDTHRIEYYDGVPVQISTHPDVLHIHTTYLDNEQNLSEEFIRSALDMKKRDPERYGHIFMGRWADVAEGAVFKKWGLVSEFPEKARSVACGLDFGYTNDQSACVRCGVIGNDLYLDEVFYQRGMLVGDLIRELKKTGLFVYADSADPRLIDEIANGGVIIYPVAKPAGSIIAGIEKMKDFDNIYVTKRSVNLQSELRNYVWAKDKDGNYINMPEDHDNHCFTGDTKIVTEYGNIDIKNIVPGTKVLTSKGWRKVNKLFDNGRRKVLHIRLKFSNFVIEIKGTPDHKIKTADGWKQLSQLTKGDVIFISKCSTEKSIDYTPALYISQEAPRNSIVKYGDITMEKFLTDITSITKMGILGTTKSAILRCLNVRHILSNILKSIAKMRIGLWRKRPRWTMRENTQMNGIARKKGERGIACMQENKRKRGLVLRTDTHVIGVGKNFSQAIRENSVPTNAKPHRDTIQELTTNCGSAQSAVRHLNATNIAKHNIAVGVVQDTQSRLSEKEEDSILNQRILLANNAEKDSLQSRLAITNIVAMNVDINQPKLRELASCAISNSGQVDTESQDFAVPYVLEDTEVLKTTIEQVYDLEVEECHEYFANGILVHNCIDASRYYINGALLGKVLKPKTINKDRLGIF